MLAQKIDTNTDNSSHNESSFVHEIKVKDGAILFGREKEVKGIIEVLARKNKSNPILIGEPGVGKTAIIQALAKVINDGEVPSVLMGKKIYSLDLSLLSVDLSRFISALKEVIDKKGILFIDEIHNVVGAGKNSGSLDAANLLKPLLTDGTVMCIGATTPTEYSKYLEKDAAFERRFSKITVAEPSSEICKKMLLEVAPQFEKHHGISISKKAIDACVDLSIRYITDRFLPDKALDLLDEACSKKSLASLKSIALINQLKKYEEEFNWEKVSEIRYSLLPSMEKNIVMEEDIAIVISDKIGIPVCKLTDDETKKLLSLEKSLSSCVIGQDHAAKIIANQYAVSRVGLSHKTISFLLLGSSGVGKTEMAKALASNIFFSKDNLTRFDMSEFQEKHSLSKLIGAPAGYVGYEEGGLLTEAIRLKPYSVILFDEVEKAHKDVYDALLQVLDEGHLTDNKGKTVSFKNTIIILTSNLTREKLHDFFRIEFLNRITEIIQFNNLSKLDIEKITYSKLTLFADKIKYEKDILVDYSEEFIVNIVDMAYNTQYGAREVDRIIHRLVEIPLSKKILNNELEKNKMIIFHTNS